MIRIKKQIIISKIDLEEADKATIPLKSISGVRDTAWDKYSDMLIVTPDEEADIEQVFVRVTNAMKKLFKREII